MKKIYYLEDTKKFWRRHKRAKKHLRKMQTKAAPAEKTRVEKQLREDMVSLKSAKIIPYSFYDDSDFLRQEYVAKEKSASQIAKEINCCHATILRKLKKFNIPTRSRSELSSGTKNPMWGRPSPMRGITGRNHHRWGKKHSVKSRKKISKSLTGKKLLEKTKIKISRAHTGMRHSLESRKKMSEIKLAKRPSDFADMRVENKRIRMSYESREWRKKVFERDDYTCLICKTRGGDLCPHHILPFIDYPQYRFDVGNGLTLCKKDHLILHRKTMWLEIYNSAFDNTRKRKELEKQLKEGYKANAKLDIEISKEFKYVDTEYL